MDIYHDTDNLRLKNTAIAIGVFDGVHLGHQAVLQRVSSTATTVAPPLLSVALTFDKHPAELLAPSRAPATISTLAQRTALMAKYGGGLGAVVTEAFNRDFASLSPDEFVQQVVRTRLGARHIFVGADFRYGKDRAGNIETLTDEGTRYGFAVTVVTPVIVDGDRVSSTRVRRLILEGDIPSAVKLLGHPFMLAGHVVPGKKLGRELGYPTANVASDEPRQLLPSDGVYSGYAVMPPSGESFRAAISVGTNPTTDSPIIGGGGAPVRKVEAYIMDGFSGDLYGNPIEIDFRSKIRDQITFDGLEPLKRQIADDVRQVQATLS